MSEPHTSAFDVDFCLYGMTMVRRSWHGQLSAGHSYRLLLLPPCAPIVLSHSVSIKQVCPTVGPCLNDAD